MGARATVVAVSQDSEHRFSKVPVDVITLVEGLGVRGDAHAGATVQHLFVAKKDPGRPNLRQVHIIDTEFLALAAAHGFDVAPGDLGENITTEHLDPLGLPRDALLHIGAEAVLRVTGLRNPCYQINDFRKGLLKVALGKDEDGHVARRVGIMTVVEHGGAVQSGDGIRVVLPPEPRESLTVV
jgi:MOSC domain-containing protein YiiM